MNATPALQRQRQAQMAAELAKAARTRVPSTARGALPPDAFKPRLPDGAQMMEKWLQAALNVVLGLKLPLDGLLKGETRLALMRFQKEAGLAAHGYLDEKTLRALEVWLGVTAPRDGRRGGLSRLWQEDRRPAASPPLPPNKPLRDDAAPVLPQGPNAAQALLQRQAELAVEQEAFERSFVHDELTRLGRHGDAALHAEMQAWLGRARQGQGPAWWVAAQEAARLRPDEAVAALRGAWTTEHPPLGREVAP